MKTYIYALIIRERDFLILQRPDNNKSQPSYWNFPGGKLEKNESYLECVKREVLEETGLIFNPLIKVFDKIDKVCKDKKVVVFLGFTNTDEIHLNEEHIQSKWVTYEDIIKLKVMPYINKLFEEVKK